MKKKRINLREIVTLSIGAAMFIIGLSALIYVCNDTIPNNLKLPAEVWGTVSDWMMIFITVVTAVLLLLTLESQRKVQDDQRLMFQLEQKKHRDSFKPSFEFSVEYNTMWADLEDGAPSHEYLLSVKSDLPTIFSIEVIESSDFRLSAVSNKRWTHIRPRTSEISLRTETDLYTATQLLCGIILRYQDREYNNYEMKIFLEISEKQNKPNELQVKEEFISDRFIDTATHT